MLAKEKQENKMDSMKAADKLRDDILATMRQAQRDAALDARLTERASWIEAIRQAAPKSFRKILLQHDIVVH